ncbi:MAG: GNAT family N-acetyltransferase [Pseudomonadales bacterium]
MDKDRSEACTIRPAVSNEAELLSELALRSKAYWDYPDEFIEACREELSYSRDQIDSSTFSFVIAESPHGVTGFYALKRSSRSELELEALFVEPDWIGYGIGRALLEHAKCAAAELGAESLIIQGDPNAQAFYLAAGGVLTGEQESNGVPGRFLPTFVISLQSSLVG